MSEIVGLWIDQLLITEKWGPQWGAQPSFDRVEAKRLAFPLPEDVAFIHCGPNVCAVGKARHPGIYDAFPGLNMRFRSGY